MPSLSKYLFPPQYNNVKLPKGHLLQQGPIVASIFNIQIYNMNSQKGTGKSTGLNKRFQQQAVAVNTQESATT